MEAVRFSTKLDLDTLLEGAERSYIELEGHYTIEFPSFYFLILGFGMVVALQ